MGIERLFDPQAADTDGAEPYLHLRFPRGAAGPVRRPYTVINMVSTLDGKVVIGGPGSTRLIGSPTDHVLMARIELHADAVLIGAGLAREDNPPYPRLTDEQRRYRAELGLRPDPLWAVVSTTANFEQLPRLFKGPRAHTALFVSSRIPEQRLGRLDEVTQVFVAGDTTVEAAEMGAILRDRLQVHSVVCLGGPTLNAILLGSAAIDEVFLTLSPKLQGGRGTATMIEGAGFPGGQLPLLSLLSLYKDGSELYLRYRVTGERG